MALNPGEDVEHRLILCGRHVVCEKFAGLDSTPDSHIKHHQGTAFFTPSSMQSTQQATLYNLNSYALSITLFLVNTND